MHKELLNCPFCGGKAKSKTFKLFGNDAVRIECGTCGALTSPKVAGTAPVFGPNSGHVFSLKECQEMAADCWNSRYHVKKPVQTLSGEIECQSNVRRKVMKMEGKLTATDVYRLCMSNGWFTCGGNRQYARVMQAADDGMNTHDIAVVIWICSDAVDLEDIEGKIADYLRWEKPQGEIITKGAV